MKIKSETHSFLKAITMFLFCIFVIIVLSFMIGFFYISAKQSNENSLLLSNNLGKPIEVKEVDLCGKLVMSNFILHKNDSFSIVLENSPCPLVIKFSSDNINYSQEFYVSSITERELLISPPPYQGVTVQY